MDPFAPPLGQGYSRRGSSGSDPNRSLPGHPMDLMSSTSSGLPSPLSFSSNRMSSFGSSSGGLARLPSPSDALRGPDRFEHSLDLPPLHGIPRSTSPILGRSSGRSRGTSELPPFGDMGGFGSGSGLNLPPYAQSGTADALIDPFAMPSSRRSRSRAGSFAMQTDTDNNKFGSLSLGQGQSYTSTRPTAPKRTSTSSSLANLPNLNDMPGFPGSSFGLTSGLSGSSGPLLSPTSGHADEAEGLQGPSHASRNIRKFSKRATFSHAQLTIMEDLWAQTEYPSNEQIERCATATGLVPKQIRTWFGNTRQARLAGTRKEARHAPIPGQPGTGTAPRRSRASDPTSIFNSAGLGSGLSTFDPSLGYSSLSPLASSSRGGFPPPLSSSGGLPTLQSLSSMSPMGPEPTATSFRSSGGQGSLFPPLDPLPLSMGGTGGLIPGLDQLGAYSGQPSSQRSRRRSIVSYPSMTFDSGLPPPSKRY